MAYRRFEGVDQTAKYARYRPMWPSHVAERVLSYLEEKLPAPHDRAVDVGCGSGQFTQLLAPHFNHVTGIDVSDNQIHEARKMNPYENIQFKTSPAENLPVDSQSVDIVTGANAAHWFDLDRFFAEADRVLKPNGCIALVAFTIHDITVDANSNGALLTQLVRDFKNTLFDANCWAKRNSGQWETLKDVYVPFADILRDNSLTLEYETTLADFLGYLSTWSGYVTYEEKYPSGTLLKTLENNMLKALDTTSPETKVHIKRPLYMLLARKPGP
ncbi:putative methyltransferase DDB_G0268948 [Lingula anatina]|uniref:Methyltransferase DDB_G0268948 n=1 Tax=Lingula anatina TaxID=7574 RepID=A0A1S3ICX4_LINAN|nr:putative methyltransferase DDB_G0268948 [Lingula anatina]XP_013395708.1 putative methyltransferase DDB_G0268948 [Lingula anatina]XP_013395709.1 putative methyltransferase DDB_G0268948 [Lingula anatina]XP_013395710.1 putative methyltransferase DDB_G0268948 [Lingula anatina]XP_013395711.1 putative methyltransferase DDB_G0268948 [Lingula anatina]|eukprot:XP_013395707.1 putative methyltransferase DDB_G0268948 [Lingula anatina]